MWVLEKTEGSRKEGLQPPHSLDSWLQPLPLAGTSSPADIVVVVVVVVPGMEPRVLRMLGKRSPTEPSRPYSGELAVNTVEEGCFLP
jgi:hypothetical protein